MTKYMTNLFRSSRPDVFCKKGVLRNFTKFTEKHLCQSLFFNKVAGLPLMAASAYCMETVRSKKNLGYSKSLNSSKIPKIFE